MSHSDFIEDYYEAYYNQHELKPDTDLEECQNEYKNVFNEWLGIGGYNDVQIDYEYYKDVSELFNELVRLSKQRKAIDISVCLYYHKHVEFNDNNVAWWISLPLPKDKKCILGVEILDFGHYIHLETEVDKTSAELIETRNEYICYKSLEQVESILNPVIRKEIINKCLLEV